MKILNAWMITISLLQLHVCYGSEAGDGDALKKQKKQQMKEKVAMFKMQKEAELERQLMQKAEMQARQAILQQELQDLQVSNELLMKELSDERDVTKALCDVKNKIERLWQEVNAFAKQYEIDLSGLNIRIDEKLKHEHCRYEELVKKTEKKINDISAYETRRYNDLGVELSKVWCDFLTANNKFKKAHEELECRGVQVSQLTEECAQLKANILQLQENTLMSQKDHLTQLKKLQKDNELLPWSETLALNARHIWAAATTASAVACAGTSYLLSKADTKSSPVLAAAAGGTGLFTLAGIFMTGKKHYVYNQAFKQTDIQKIQTPADQRKLLENIQALDGKTSITSWMFYPSQQNNN